MREMRQQLPLLRLAPLLMSVVLVARSSQGVPFADEIDGPETRKLLGSSVVTSMSVIMDHPNGTKTYITDGEPAVKPTVVGSPASLMSPDRYEFYSFGKDGDLVKKLMTLDQIQGLIAGADELNLQDENGQPAHYYQQPLVQAGEPEGVSKVLESVQNVLRSEMQTAHVPDHLDVPPLADDSWSILFPGLFNGDYEFKESIRGTPKPANVTETPVPETTNPTTTYSTTVQAVKVTSPRQPLTTTSKAPERPSSKTTARRPPQSQATTVKYSAHYSTPPPNIKLQNKPAPVVKKPTGTQPKPQQAVKTTVSPTASRPSNNGTVPSSRLPSPTTQRPKINATVAPTYKAPNATINTTLKPTTPKGTTERMRPSGIPTITHYLPVQTSIGPSDAVKTVKPMMPTKPTVKTTPMPTTIPTKPYSNPQPTIPSLRQPTNKPSSPSTTTPKVQVSSSTVPQAPSTVKNQVPASSTKNQPVAEKLVQKRPDAPLLQAASSDMISVSVSTPSGPPSTLKITAGTTVRPTTPRPTSKVPLVSIQPNKTQTAKPTTQALKTDPQTAKPTTQALKTDPPTPKPHPTPAISTSSIATHKPVLVMATTSKPQVKISPNSSSSGVPTTPRAPISTSTKYVSSGAPQTRPATVTQSRLPTTAVDVGTTAAYTQPSTTPGSTTTVDVSTTLSNELAQAPLKLAATLKEPEQNMFEQVPLVSTTLKEVPTIMTTAAATTESTTKWEQIASSAQALTGNPSTLSAETGNPSTLYAETGNPSTLSAETGNPSTLSAESSTMTVAGSTLVTTEVPTTLNKVYIINNSEPQKIKIPVKPTQKPPYSSAMMSSTIADWINSRTESLQTTGVTSTSTTTTTDAPSTITESPSTTTFKDQVMEEGMSAVASILLDDKLAVDKNALAERLSVPITSPEPSRPTTEATTVTRAETTIKEEAAFREEPVESDRASTRREDDSWRTTTSLPSTLTSSAETATIPPPTTAFVTDTKKEGEKSSVVSKENVTSTTPAETPSTLSVTSTTTTTNPSTTARSITTSTASSTVLPPLRKEEHSPVKSKPPIKESKLNPDSDEQPQESQVQAQQMNAEGTTMIMEQIKLTEKDSVAPSLQPPPPPAPSMKIPFQEPKIPPPALKRPSYSNEVIPPPAIELHPAPYESMGAEASTAFLAEDVRRFADLCNELAFRLWTAVTSKGDRHIGQISSRSLVMSPFAAISLLAMVFLGARGATSGQMNEILRLDDMVTFNPHQVLQNVTDTVINSRDRGVATAAFVRQLYSDKSKGKILDFYKERAQQYYGGHVEEVSFSTVGDVVRRRTNLLVKRQTLGKVPEYLRGSSLNLRPPLAAFSANIFQTDCESGSTDGRDGEMYFVVRPSTRQRRLVPVPAVVWRTGFSAGYEPSLDATSVCLGEGSVVSTLLILPGQQGQVAPGDGLARLEQRLIETSYRRGGWSRLLRSLLPRPGLELQVPRFSHRSVLNVTAALERMGLRDLFTFKADLRGLNGGATELHLSDMVQVNTFSTCGEEVLGARHHIETYPASPQRTGREDAPLPKYLDDEPHYEPRRPRYHFNGNDMIDGRPRTGRLPMAAPSTDPAPPRLRFDRPFLYVVRHNPSGIILHIGRFNPRLLP